MPGLSLWLVPYNEHPFNHAAQELISDTVPRQLALPGSRPNWPPHVTVTSGIAEEKIVDGGKTAQEWLDELRLPRFRKEHDQVLLELERVEAEEPFFRKLNVACRADTNLSELVAACRRAAGLPEDDGWEYRPHLSLLYADLPTRDVRDQVPLIEMKIGFAFGDLFACCGGALCLGGNLVLVDTRKPIHEWKDSILATRETPWATWRATRALI